MVEIAKLNNGIRVAIEQTDFVKSVAIGVWIGAGCCYENEKNNGISHFIEHMLFKGTDKRSAKDIAECVDDIGGQINAYTTKEYTCLYAKTLSEHLDLSVELLSDLVLNPSLEPKNIDLEKGVVIEEINMYEDTPDEVAFENLQMLMWRGSSISQTILGEKEIVSSFTREDLRHFMDRYYVPENMVISVVGSFDREYLLEMLNERFGGFAARSDAVFSWDAPKYNPSQSYITKNIEQLHLNIGYPAFKHTDNRVFGLEVMNSILGSGVSSRLFQRIREEKGLAYSVYSYDTTYKNAGLLGIDVALTCENADEVKKLINECIESLINDGISEKELYRSKEQIKSSMILGTESTTSRMTSNGKLLLLNGKIETMEYNINEINKIDIDAIYDIMKVIFSNEPTIVEVGPSKRKGR